MSDNQTYYDFQRDQGFSAWITGRSREENPYQPGSREWEAWDHGWVEAEEND